MVGYKHQSAIGNLESRATGQGGNKIGLIADALQVSLEWLLRGPDSDVVPIVKKQSDAAYPPPPATVALVIHDGEPNRHIDPWTYEAVQILSRLTNEDRRAAVLSLRAFVHNLGPPRDGQAVPVAA